MNIYIDCGAHNGDTVDCESLFNFAADRKIAFEPNKKLHKDLNEVGFDEVYRKAVWIKDDKVKFYIDDSKSPMGSTLMKHKRTGKLRLLPQLVDTIDFSAYLKQFENDTVLIKMDCEGAEFAILEKMLEDGTTSIPKKMYVEFHPNKVPEYTTDYKNDLISRLKQAKLKIKEWH